MFCQTGHRALKSMRVRIDEAGRCREFGAGMGTFTKRMRQC
jgi:hypothetical protein